jgi:hypothetical protein
MINDPKRSWYSYQGTIEQASLSVRPNGVYLEYGLFLTFSTKGTSFTSSKDTVEVVLNFDLPENAIVHDSWLWIGDDIIKAKILDKWSASAIYEGIVKRRMDPSILTKKSATQYELRVFPMAGNQKRKVKITYLMPATWDKYNVSAGLPTAIINTSKILPPYLQVIAFKDSTWNKPSIVNDETIQFSSETDSIFGDFSRANINETKYKSSIKMGYNNPMKNGYYFSRYKNGNDGVYQFAMLPEAMLDSTQVTKAAILVDYDITNSPVYPKDLLNTIKNKMLNYLNDKDSFNLIFTNLSPVRYSETWLPASSANIEKAFSILSNPLSNYSNLPTLIANGIDFIKKNGNEGKIILISNSDNYGENQIANKLISDIISLMNPKIQINIADYQSTSFPNYYINSVNYYGNDYLYSNLSRITYGSYHRVKNGLSLAETIEGSFKNLGGAITSFDLYTRMQSGLCYSRYNLSGNNSINYLNDAIIQVGKFKGDFPFKVELSGEYNSKLFVKEIGIDESEAILNDSTSNLIWTGQYLKELESGQQSNVIINEIIYNSLKERILSLYTSFLCIEDTNMICRDCMDESRLVRIENIKSDQDSITVFPNPFKDQLTIELICSNPEKVSKLAIYSITGALIYQFDLSGLVKGKNILTWDSKNLKSGVYLLVYSNGSTLKKIKIIKK